MNGLMSGNKVFSHRVISGILYAYALSLDPAIKTTKKETLSINVSTKGANRCIFCASIRKRFLAVDFTSRLQTSGYYF